MHSNVSKKSSKFRTCWHAWRLANVIACCHFFDITYATTTSTTYQTIYCNSFPTILILFYTLGLTVCWKIHQNRSAWLPTSNTLWPCIISIVMRYTGQCYSLIVISSVLYLVFYNSFYETWSRKCIKWIGSEMANTVFSFGIIQNFSIYEPAEITP